MEDDNVNNNRQVHRVYGMDINTISNTKTFEPPSIFTISGNSLNSRIELVSDNKDDDEEEDGDSDVISELIGHIGPWQLFWAVMMCLYQFPTTFHIFCLVFQVSFSADLWTNLLWKWINIEGCIKIVIMQGMEGWNLKILLIF